MWCRHVKLIKEDSNIKEKLNSNICAKKEVESYLNISNMNPNTDIFQYWKSNNDFLRLKKL